MIKPIVKTIVVGGIQTNCYVVKCPETGATLVIDPGDDHELIEKGLTRVDFVVYTHGHFDHVGAAAHLIHRFEPVTMIHSADAEMLASAAIHAGEWGFRINQPLPADRLLEDGDQVNLGVLTFFVRHTPGHSMGSVCLEGHGLLFSGDTLFAGSIGRTDLPQSSPEKMRATLEQIVMHIDDNSVVYPGHGPLSTMKKEKQSNPFLKQISALALSSITLNN